MRKTLALAAFAVFVVACDTPAPTAPAAEEMNVPGPQLATTASPKSNGKPEIFRDQFAYGFVIACQTFDMQLEAEGRWSSKAWFNDDGSIRFKDHYNESNTFTNLSTMESVVADFVGNADVVISADGEMIVERRSGATLKVRRDGKGPQIAYEMGRTVATIDFSSFPPTFDFDFKGRQDFGAGPCVDLGDPPFTD